MATYQHVYTRARLRALRQMAIATGKTCRWQGDNIEGFDKEQGHWVTLFDGERYRRGLTQN